MEKLGTRSMATLLLIAVLVILLILEGFVILFLLLVPPSCKVEVVEWQCVIIPRSNADHGETLDEVIRGISQEPYEYAAVFYDDRKLFEVTSQSDNRVRHVTCPTSCELVHVHNHPADEAPSFSYRDLRFYSRAGNYTLGIVVTQGAVHLLKAPNGWPSLEEVTDFFVTQFGVDLEVYAGYSEQSSNEAWTQAYNRLVEMEAEGYVVLGVGASFRGVGFTSKLISDFADYFGLVYTEQPLPNA